MRITLVAFNARYTHSCLGLFHVRNELENHFPDLNHEFLQLTINDSTYEALLRITATRPDYVFFSAAIWNSNVVADLIRSLTTCLPACKCVVGGPQAEVIGATLKEGTCTVVLGPVEAVNSDFYRDLAARNLKLVYGSCSSSSAKGYSFVSPYRDSDFRSHLVNRHVYYETSRGCPFSCIYCLSSAQKGVLHKDLPQVAAELSHILSHRPRVVRFIDRTFNDRPERALAIWRFLVEQQTQTLYHFEISPDRFTDEMFDFLRGVPQGMFQFEIGIQSTNPDTLKAVRRPMDVGKAHEIVTKLASLNTIFLHVDLILGLPYETAQSFYLSFADVFSMSPHYIQMGLLKILPDTPICHTSEEYGYRFCSTPPYSILANKWIDHEKLRDLYWFCECVERFVNNRYFLSLWSYLRRKGEDITAFFLHLLSVCLSRSFFSLSPTQELLCSMLLAATSSRSDAPVVFELLRFDWLRCGHRFLPKCLATAEETSSVLKKRLFHVLPESIDGVYDVGEKNQFCKKGLFLIFSENSLLELGYSAQKGKGCLCFLPEKVSGLYGFSRVVHLPLDGRCLLA